MRDLIYRIVPLVQIIALSTPGGLFHGWGNRKRRSRLFRRPQIHFPEDEGAHPTSLLEWWYVNFSLADSSGRKYGAMAAYFNMGLKIISISDLQAEDFRHEVFGSAPHYSEGALNLRWGGRDHWFRTEDRDSLSYRLESHGNEIDLNLDMVSQKPPLLAGGDGLIEWSGGLSYYYSLTRLLVEGQIGLGGKTIDVEGIGWMDHQWMESLGERGWDWFSVQLDNQTEINFW
ncbi:MAG: lipocalin-like domain-containing protein, partial [Dehalococcoidia bacterium]